MYIVGKNHLKLIIKQSTRTYIYLQSTGQVQIWLFFFSFLVPLICGLHSFTQCI